MKRTPHAVLAMLSAATVLFAQQAIDPSELRVASAPYWPRAPYTLKVDTRLVEVGVVVRDSHGRAVAGLGRNDFDITDSGKHREITAFSVESFIPLAATARNAGAPPSTTGPPAPKTPQRFVALLFDDLSLSAPDLTHARAAAQRFVKEGLAAGDQVGIFTTSAAHTLGFTGDVPQLSEAIGQLYTRQSIIDGGTCPHMTPYDAYLIANHLDQSSLEVKVQEAMNCRPQPGGSRQSRGRGGTVSLPPDIVQQVQSQANAIWEQVRMLSRTTLSSIQSTVDYLARMPGRHMILLASSGFLSGTLEREQDEITRRALRAGVVINSLDAKGLFTEEPIVPTMGAGVQSIIRTQLLGTAPQQASNDALGTLAASTGGLFFHNNNDLGLGFHELGMVPEFSYLLGFAPDARPDERFHRLKVRLTSSKHCTVEARLGYFATAAAPPEQPKPERRIDREILATDTLDEVPIRVTALSGRMDSGATAVQVGLHMDVKRLPFVIQGEVRTQKVKFIAALLDEQGNYVTGKEGTVEFALKDSTFTQLSEEGLNATLVLEAAPGTYRLRGVAEADGKVAASTQAVELK